MGFLLDSALFERTAGESRSCRGLQPVSCSRCSNKRCGGIGFVCHPAASAGIHDPADGRRERRHRNAVRRLVPGPDELLVDDRVIVLDYLGNGARYEVFSLWSNDTYFVTFLRRAPPDEDFDPAVILMIELEDDAVAYLDYRYD